MDADDAEVVDDVETWDLPYIAGVDVREGFDDLTPITGSAVQPVMMAGIAEDCARPRTASEDVSGEISRRRRCAGKEQGSSSGRGQRARWERLSSEGGRRRQGDSPGKREAPRETTSYKV
jgi:hypothetical protein